MATLEATRVKCPECGATIHASEGAATLKCEYCGIESRVQRRTQIFQLPMRMPTPTADHPQRVAVAVRTRVWPVVLILIASVGVPIIGVIVSVVAKHGHWGDTRAWNGNTPLLIDVDGDGTEDAIGLARYIQQDKMTIVALSGKDGHTLWETPSLGKYNDNYRQRISIIGNMLVRADTDQRAHVEAYDAKTGVRKWEATPAEVVDHICAGSSPADALLITKDKRAWKLGIADGSLAAAVAPGDSCIVLPNDDHDTMGARFRDHKRPKIDGMDVHHVEGDVTPLVAVGSKSPGTSIPMLAALDGGDTVLWKTEVPGHDALQAKHSYPGYVAVTDHDVAVVYEREGKKAPELTVFDRATGTRRFEVTTRIKGSSSWLHAIAASKTAVFVGLDLNLQAFDLQTGKALFTVGRMD